MPPCPSAPTARVSAFLPDQVVAESKEIIFTYDVVVSRGMESKAAAAAAAAAGGTRAGARSSLLACAAMPCFICVSTCIICSLPCLAVQGQRHPVGLPLGHVPAGHRRPGKRGGRAGGGGGPRERCHGGRCGCPGCLRRPAGARAASSPHPARPSSPPCSLQVHWFSIVNSLMIVLFLRQGAPVGWFVA